MKQWKKCLKLNDCGEKNLQKNDTLNDGATVNHGEQRQTRWWTMRNGSCERERRTRAGKRSWIRAWMWNRACSGYTTSENCTENISGRNSVEYDSTSLSRLAYILPVVPLKTFRLLKIDRRLTRLLFYRKTLQTFFVKLTTDFVVDIFDGLLSFRKTIESNGFPVVSLCVRIHDYILYYFSFYLRER